MRRYHSLFYYLALANFLFFLGNSFYILLPVFLKNMGASESYIGVMNNVDKVFSIIAAVGIGSLMHGRDRIRLLRLGYLILVIAYSSYLLVSSLTWMLLAIRIVHGIGFSVAMILGTSIIFDIVSIKDAAEAIGLYGITGALSNALSPFFGELLLSHGYSHYLIFALSVLLVSLSLAITFIMPRVQQHNPSKDQPVRRGSLHLFNNPRFIYIVLATIIFGGGFGVIVTYLPNFIRTTTNYKFSYFFIIYIIILIIIRFTFIKSVGRINRNILLIIVFSIGALMNLFLNYLNSIIMLLTVSIMYGITHGVLYPVLNTILVSLVPSHDRGKANALFTASFNAGMMIFALSLGFLIDYSGTYLAAFDVCAAMFILATVLLAVMTIKHGNLDVIDDRVLTIE
jgi:predicted MFS family arabinose efflux permease